MGNCCLNSNNLNIEDNGAPAGPQGIVVIDIVRHLHTFPDEKTESADNHLDVFDVFMQIQQINIIDANVA